MSTRSATPSACARSRARAACGSDSVMPVTWTPCSRAAWTANELELGPLRLLERLRAARPDGARVRHRLVEEQREELVRDVVVVADRALVAVRTVAAPARAQLRGAH